jgi:hypothetical protein
LKLAIIYLLAKEELPSIVAMKKWKRISEKIMMMTFLIVSASAFLQSDAMVLTISLLLLLIDVYRS